MAEATCPLRPYADVAGVCDACGTRLVGRQTRWCGRTCARTDLRNHRWTTARAAAKRRDRNECSYPVPTGRCRSKEKLEVNHIIPRNGQGYGYGCWNHLDNLETLCRRHHRVVTNEQAAARRAVSV